MSGLLVKSTAFMKENLSEFNKADISVPVILGGAALTPKLLGLPDWFNVTPDNVRFAPAPSEWASVYTEKSSPEDPPDTSKPETSNWNPEIDPVDVNKISSYKNK